MKRSLLSSIGPIIILGAVGVLTFLLSGNHSENNLIKGAKPKIAAMIPFTPPAGAIKIGAL